MRSPRQRHPLRRAHRNDRRSWPRAAVATALLTASPLLAPRVAGAQVFQVEGGGSSLFEGYGGILHVWGNGYDGSLGVGYLDGLRIGWSARRLLGGRDTLRVGNDGLPFVLDTDIFGGGSVVLAQGASLQRRRGRTTLQAFAGASANAVAAPYFASNEPAKAMSYTRAQYNVSRTLSLTGHAVITDRQSVLGSARWTPVPGVRTSATAGVGSNAPYAAVALERTMSRLETKAAYMYAGTGFRRASAPMPLQSELDGENVLVTWHATPSLSLSGGRQHFRQDSAFAGIPGRATLNQVAANARLLGTQVSAGFFQSRAGGMGTVASSFSARRDLGSRLEGEFYLLRVWKPEPARVTTPVLVLREAVTPRLSLLQVVTHEAGRTSVNFGGTINTGLNTLSLDYQVVHSPYLSRNPFVQTIGLNARVQVFGYALTVGSFVTPDGKVHYSAQGSTFFYRGLTGSGAAPIGDAGRVDAYVVLGQVVDETGEPIEGAALEIGGDLLYTDSRGRFFYRRPATRALALRVVLDDFLVPGTFALVSAPDEVTPARDARAVPVKIVVRRVTSAH